MLAAGAHADTIISQTFDSSWTIAPWNYYGDTAAQQWHYLPYVPVPLTSAFGTLESVTISTSITGTKDASDTVSMRYAFVTGWSPADYQFYNIVTIANSSTTFSISNSFRFNTLSSLGDWINPQYLPQADYYFESKSTLTHSVNAKTVLTYDYVSAVPEPESYAMLLAGLGLMGFIVRRRKIS